MQAGINPIHSCSSIWHTFPSQFDNYHPSLFQRCKINVNDHSNNVTKIMNPMHADRKWKWLKVTLLLYVIITAMVQMFLWLFKEYTCMSPVLILLSFDKKTGLSHMHNSRTMYTCMLRVKIIFWSKFFNPGWFSISFVS